MRSSTSSGSSGTGGSRSQGRTGSRSRGTQPVGRVNRAQMRAMQARTAEAPIDAVTGDLELAGTTAGSASLSSIATRRRPVVRPIVLTREEEYAYIKQDMRRLVIIAGALLVLMLVLLFIID